MTECLRNFPSSFAAAIRVPPGKRSEEEVREVYGVIRSFPCLARMEDAYILDVARHCEYIHKSANDILYCRGELASHSYILLSGSVFIDLNMFLPVTSFGRRPFTATRRPNECLILEPSTMLQVSNDIHRLSSYSACSSEETNSSSSAGYSGSETMGSAELDLEGLQESTVDSDENCDDEDDYDYLEGDGAGILRDAVRECLEKDPLERSPSDIQHLLEFTQHLTAFNDLTNTVRRALCQVMVFAVVDKAGTIVLNHGEELDSWSVVVHGSVEITRLEEVILLGPGDSFGLPPTLDTQWFQGEMRTRVDDCQFICVTQEDYYRILKQGQDSQITTTRNNTTVLITELKTVDSSLPPSPVIIRGTISELMSQLVFQENPSIDPTYIEDFLLTYRIFTKAEVLAEKLVTWFAEDEVKDKVTRVVLLWVNNHFGDFEGDKYLLGFLCRFQLLLESHDMSGQLRLLQIACSAKSRPRTLTLTRSNRDEPLNFQVMGGSDNGYGIYVSHVDPSSRADLIGLRAGDEILTVNGAPCGTLCKTFDSIMNCTHVVMTVKCNFLGHYECVHSRTPLIPRINLKETLSNTTHVLRKKAGKKRFHDIKIFLKLNLMGGAKVEEELSSSRDDEGRKGEETMTKIDYPENVLKIYRSDQTYKYFLVNKETTAREVVMLAIQEFLDLQNENSRDWTLFQVSVTNGILKQGRLPDTLDSLAERVPLGARYYIRRSTSTAPLLPDDQIPDLIKDSEVNFLQLNPLELALQLTLEDYTIFRQIESIEFVNDLFELGDEAGKENLGRFADLVNRETFWVVTEIVREPSILKRVNVIKRFIKIASQCKECRNYNSMFAIVSGLGHGAVSRLKVTWDKLSRKYGRVFQDMTHLMDPTRNMGKYRTLLSNPPAPSSTPCIPFYPVIRKDLTFIDLGNSTIINNLVNFEKMRMLAKEIRTIIQMSNLPFDTSQQPTLASMNQLNSVTTTKGKKKGKCLEVNSKKMFEEMNMIRKIKTYLGRLDVLQDESLLYSLSFSIEPQPGAGRRIRAPGSPTLSLSSQSSQESRVVRAPRFPGENYQKLMSLSERSVVVGGASVFGGGDGARRSRESAPQQQQQRPQQVQQRPNTSSVPNLPALLNQESSSVLPATAGR